MSLVLFDFECRDCRHVFEELVDRNAPSPVKCEKCGQFNTRRLITGTRIDPKLGTDPSFPTMADAWARKHREAVNVERKRKRDHEGDR